MAFWKMAGLEVAPRIPSSIIRWSSPFFMSSRESSSTQGDCPSSCIFRKRSFTSTSLWGQEPPCGPSRQSTPNPRSGTERLPELSAVACRTIRCERTYHFGGRIKPEDSVCSNAKEKAGPRPRPGSKSGEVLLSLHFKHEEYCDGHKAHRNTPRSRSSRACHPKVCLRKRKVCSRSKRLMYARQRRLRSGSSPGPSHHNQSFLGSHRLSVRGSRSTSTNTSVPTTMGKGLRLHRVLRAPEPSDAALIRRARTPSRSQSPRMCTP